MMQLQQLVAEVNNIGRQMAEKINEPFDEYNVYVHPYDDGELSIQYYGKNRNAEVVIEINATNEVTYYDPDDIEEIEGD